MERIHYVIYNKEYTALKRHALTLVHFDRTSASLWFYDWLDHRSISSMHSRLTSFSILLKNYQLSTQFIYFARVDAPRDFLETSPVIYEYTIYNHTTPSNNFFERFFILETVARLGIFWRLLQLSINIPYIIYNHIKAFNHFVENFLFFGCAARLGIFGRLLRLFIIKIRKIIFCLSRNLMS